MGGLACQVRRNAVLQFQSVPTDPKALATFDAQMRTLFAGPDIAETLVNEAPTKVKTVCDTLAKTAWTAADRTVLLDVVESFYEGSYG